MNKIMKIKKRSGLLPMVIFAAALLFLCSGRAEAMIEGITGSNFALTAKADYIVTQDGGAWLLWGYADANGSGRAQYPGPTLIVTEGQAIQITLTNELSVPVSMVFPGQGPVTATGDTEGQLTWEANAAGGTATYKFVAGKPGTYMYHSGTQADLQVDMGLVGALIVRPAGFDINNKATWTAYNHPGSAYDREFLFFLSEMDPLIHYYVEFFGPESLNGTDLLSTYFPNYWFMNGRTATDDMLGSNPPGEGLFPTQPYNCMPMMRPGEKILMRVIGAGRQIHPLHHHGNHARVIARDGMLLDTGTLTGLPDLSEEVFTIQSVPGQTADAIFEWTGKGMGWDIYGADAVHEHQCNGMSVAQAQALRASTPNDAYFASQDMMSKEWCRDHGKPIPVVLPDTLDLTMGPHFSGSPYLGRTQDPILLPPTMLDQNGKPALNPDGAYMFMWHSHSEKELCNFGVFPGGMMTMMMIHPMMMNE